MKNSPLFLVRGLCNSIKRVSHEVLTFVGNGCNQNGKMFMLLIHVTIVLQEFWFVYVWVWCAPRRGGVFVAMEPWRSVTDLPQSGLVFLSSSDATAWFMIITKTLIFVWIFVYTAKTLGKHFLVDLPFILKLMTQLFYYCLLWFKYFWTACDTALNLNEYQILLDTISIVQTSSKCQKFNDHFNC